VPSDLTSKRILVVEDDDFTREILRRLLRKLGAGEVLEGDDGAAGLEVIGRRPVDLVLCDIDMKPLDGMQFARLVRAMDAPACDTPIVFITGAADERFVLQAKELGARGYLLKPVTPAKLQAVIDAAFRAP